LNGPKVYVTQTENSIFI